MPYDGHCCERCSLTFDNALLAAIPPVQDTGTSPPRGRWDEVCSEKHDGLNALALAVECARPSSQAAKEAAAAQKTSVDAAAADAASSGGMLTALLERRANPVRLIDASPDLPESINGAAQPRYKRSPLSIALAASLRGEVGAATGWMA